MGAEKWRGAFKQRGYFMNRKRVQRLMRQMDIQTIYPKSNLIRKSQGYKIYPYLLKEVKNRPPLFWWSADITYIALIKVFCILLQ